MERFPAVRIATELQVTSTGKQSPRTHPPHDTTSPGDYLIGTVLLLSLFAGYAAFIYWREGRR